MPYEIWECVKALKLFNASMEHTRVILFKGKILEEAMLKIRYTLHVLKCLSRSVILKTLSRPITNLFKLVLIHHSSILTANSISFFSIVKLKILHT